MAFPKRNKLQFPKSFRRTDERLKKPEKFRSNRLGHAGYHGWDFLSYLSISVVTFIQVPSTR